MTARRREAGWSAADKRKLFHDNAVRVYRLDMPDCPFADESSRL